MNKKDYIKKYGEAAYLKKLESTNRWKEEHQEAVENNSKEHSRKGGKRYAKWLLYKRTGLQGERNKVRHRHGNIWRIFKNIIAPWSVIHHEWIPGTAKYRGVALVEKDQHQHGYVDVIRILDGKITLLAEEEKRRSWNDIDKCEICP